MKIQSSNRIAALSVMAMLAAAASGSAVAASASKQSLQACTAAAAQVLDTPRPDPSWFAPVADADKQLRIELSNALGEWEFQCDASTGALTSAEWSGADRSNSPLALGLTVTEAEAIERVKERIPGGVIDEASHRMTAGGLVSYEFDVRTPEGKLHEVDVNGATGEVVSTAIEVEKSPS
jgi:uncharacterized membrane protein YkoI